MKSETWRSVSIRSNATAAAENNNGANVSYKSRSYKRPRREEDVRQEGAWALKVQLHYIFLWVHPSAWFSQSS